MEIVPAILTNTYEDLKNKISIIRGFIPLVQIDICDGKFVKSQTWPFISGNNLDKHFLAILDEREGMPFWEDIDFELDLMVMDAIENFDIYTKLSPKRIIFHLEAFENEDILNEFLEGIDPYIKDMIEFGVAKKPNTSMEKLEKIIPNVSFVQLMGIENIGYQGEELQESILEDIKFLKNKYEGLRISVDGGVNEYNGVALKEVGVDTLVSGSAIYYSDDVIGKIEYFKSL
jgi:pentose-5-phosphate-3-epimerase